MGVSMIVLLATLQSFDVFASQRRPSDARHRRQRPGALGHGPHRARPARRVADPARDARPTSSTPSRTPRARASSACASRGNRALRHVDGDVRYAGGADHRPARAARRSRRCESTSSTAFTYDGATSSATPATVKNVGLTFSLDASGGGKTASSTLKASAARRSAGTLPITHDDLDATCNASGALLSLGVSLADYGALTVTYASTGGISLGTAERQRRCRSPRASRRSSRR